MKKWLIVIIFSFILFPKSVFAEYKLDNAGNYYVDNGYCTYQTEWGGSDIEIKINIKDAEFSGFETGFGYNPVYVGSLKYETFFINKEFSCPEKIYYYYSTSAPMGVYLQSACDESSVACTVADIVTSKMKADYVELAEGEKQPEIKDVDFTCSYDKVTSGSTGTALQRESFSKLIYKKYKDGSQSFYSGSKKYPIEDDSIELTSCDNVQIYLKAISEGKHIKGYKIVDSCNDNTDTKCIIYRRENTLNTVDSSLNDDGTSNNASELVDSNLVKTSVISSNIDLNVANNCNSYLGSPDRNTDPAYYLSFAFDLLKYAAILVLFGMTIADIAKAIVTKEDEFKKAIQKAIKRFIIVVIIFFLPILVEFLFEMFGIYTDPSCLVKK